MSQPPNVLLLMADQFRADALGCVGGWVRTPNLDKLARSGCLFGQAYANSVECIPSRLSFATGLYPHQFGVDTNRRCQLAPDAPSWMRIMRDGGYRTALVGKTHLHPHEGDLRDRLGLMHAYGLQHVDETVGPRAAADVRCNMTERWENAGLWEAYRADVRSRFATRPHLARPTPLPLELYYDRYVGESGRQMLLDLPAGEPWFCWISFGGPHEPWDAPPPYDRMYAPEDMPAPIPVDHTRRPRSGLLAKLGGPSPNRPDMSPGEIAEMRANYAGNVTLIDDEIGQILVAVEARGDLDRTLIVFVSDHGEMNGDYGLVYKSNFLDPAARVPLIIRPPAASAASMSSCDQLVGLMDVGETILDYAGLSSSGPSQGRSLRPLIERRDGAVRDDVLVEFGGHACLVTPTHKAEFDDIGRLCSLVDRVADPLERQELADVASPSVLSGLTERFATVLAQSPLVPGVVDTLPSA